MKTFLTCVAAALAIAACSKAPSEAPAPDEARETAAQAAPGAAGGTYAAEGVAALTLPELAAAIKAGDVTSEEATKTYIARIEAVDWAGPELQSVLALNPDALDAARAADAQREAGEALGALHGVPVLLKDNIETADPMATTAGALALKDNVTGRDSPLAAGLRAQGAIILGKTNLSQWANFRSNASMSGWSALGGQVKNPHMLDRNPCGSSSGSGAAVAASLAAGAVGTETNGSIICPSNVNGVVGFKPTVGLVSQDYIVPISFSQDTAGPMTKTVTGAAMMLNAMATGEAKTDYVAALDLDALDGARIGVLRFAEGSNADISEKFSAALEAMEAAGAVLVDIDKFEPATENFRGKGYEVLLYEFKATLNDYLADAAPAVTTRSLDDLIAFNEGHADIELALFDQSIFEEAAEKNGLDDPDYISARDDVQKAAGPDGLDALMAEHQVDILVSPSGPVTPRVDPVNGDVWPDWAGAGYLAAMAGYPHLTVPMGTVHDLPIGVSFMGAKNEDAKVLSFGYAYEQKTMARAEPKYLPTAQALNDIAAAMKRKAE
ncbi:amidase [Hyphococcus luteus]|uniref:Amidase n=1 Tax=Hyphococcus luteus TaxID=2058213 RepID=A0A2S7K1W7_9PROT|nr:amidase [Marinicaulis flavus]PQA86504.1 amidase [Marinicaulis flavus]